MARWPEVDGEVVEEVSRNLTDYFPDLAGMRIVVDLKRDAIPLAATAVVLGENVEFAVEGDVRVATEGRRGSYRNGRSGCRGSLGLIILCLKLGDPCLHGFELRLQFLQCGSHLLQFAGLGNTRRGGGKQAGRGECDNNFLHDSYPFQKTNNPAACTVGAAYLRSGARGGIKPAEGRA